MIQPLSQLASPSRSAFRALLPVQVALVFTSLLAGWAITGYSAEYGYLPGSDRLRVTTFKNGGAARLVTTRTWEGGERLQTIQNFTGATNVSSHIYFSDALDRRTRATLLAWEEGLRCRCTIIGWMVCSQ